MKKVIPILLILIACSSQKPPQTHVIYKVQENGDIGYYDSTAGTADSMRIVPDPFDAIFSGGYDSTRAARVADSLHVLYPGVPRLAFLRPK